jgi:hypothetical protein
MRADECPLLGAKRTLTNRCCNLDLIPRSDWAGRWRHNHTSDIRSSSGGASTGSSRDTGFARRFARPSTTLSQSTRCWARQNTVMRTSSPRIRRDSPGCLAPSHNREALVSLARWKGRLISMSGLLLGKKTGAEGAARRKGRSALLRARAGLTRLRTCGLAAVGFRIGGYLWL